MCENSEGASNILLPDGKCNKCKNKVHNNYVSCLICKCKFHATGCSNDIDICTPTFLNTFKLFSEKSAPKYAARPGNFHFICDGCQTRFEINKASTDSEKVDSLTMKVNNLESSLSEIKSILRNQWNTSVSSVSDSSVADSVETQLQPTGNIKSGKPWALQNKFAPLANMEPVIENDKQLSAIIIPAAENEAVKKSQMKLINKAVMQSKVEIRKSFEKKNGDTVILCNSEQTRESLKAEIENVVPDIQIKSPDKHRETIAVVGFDDSYEEVQLVAALVDQNFFLKAFASAYKLSEHLKYVDTKPLRNDCERFQAVFRVSKELRQILHAHNDRLIVGVISCRVYNRVFVKRCAICQRYGHFFAHCQFKDHPHCAFCGEDHETNDCLKDSGKKCVNCVRANCADTHHEASSKQCPVYLDALKSSKISLN